MAMTAEAVVPSPVSLPPLGVLACAGPLPIEVARAALRSGRQVFVVGIEGFAGAEIAEFPHTRVNIGQVGHMLAAWRAAGCHDLVIAGAMLRPNLLRIKVDRGFFRAIRTALSLTRGGDDSILRRVIAFFEREGLRVVGPHTVAPHLLATSGAFGAVPADGAGMRQVARGAALIAELGAFDVGQAVLVAADRVIAIEGVRGTDAMLRAVAGTAGRPAAGGVLVKLPKPGQEQRIDLPTIGPETVRRAVEIGLVGIAVGAGHALVLERDRMVAEADAAGLFVVGTGEATAHGAGPPAQVVHGLPVLDVVGRYAPTRQERIDIGIGMRVLDVLACHRAGRGVVVAGEHVLGIDAALPLPTLLSGIGRGSHWGLRAVRRRIGVLVIAALAPPLESDVGTLVASARAIGLAGIAIRSRPEDQDAITLARTLADAARLFLLMPAAVAPSGRVAAW